MTVNDIVTYTGRNIIFPVEGALDLVSGRVAVTTSQALGRRVIRSSVRHGMARVFTRRVGPSTELCLEFET